MALCSRTNKANSRKRYAVREVMQLRAVGNFVSADRIQVDESGYSGTGLNPDRI